MAERAIKSWRASKIDFHKIEADSHHFMLPGRHCFSVQCLSSAFTIPHPAIRRVRPNGFTADFNNSPPRLIQSRAGRRTDLKNVTAHRLRAAYNSHTFLISTEIRPLCLFLLRGPGTHAAHALIYARIALMFTAPQGSRNRLRIFLSL